MTKMKLVLTTAAMIAIIPMTAMAAGENNVGSCGWGSKVWAGQRGLVPQIGATSTNGTSGNQTFAITSGTSGCTQDGAVSSNWKTAMYIDGNKSKLAQDMSKGSGESLESLAQLIGVKDADKVAFYRATKENFAQIFVSEQASADQIASALKQVMAADSTLAQYTAAI
jgi:hypothetical protein